MSERETRSITKSKSRKASSVTSGTKRTISPEKSQLLNSFETEKSIIQDTYAVKDKSESEKSDDTMTTINKRTKTHNERDDDV
jgi:hypothetical protein